jgi:chromate transporter
VAGGCFILPAAALTAVIAWAYVRLGNVLQVGGVLYGIKPVVIAIVVQALWRLAPKAVRRSWGLACVGAAAGVASAMAVSPLAILLGAGVASIAARRGAGHAGERVFGAPALATLTGGAAASAPASVGLLTLFFTFVKIGAVVYGSGYVLLAFLRADFVDRLHWLTESQLLDAVAVGQVTPGPVFTAATFIGYVVGGAWGAVLATAGIFLPGFILVAATRPLIARVRRSAAAGAFLDGVNVASLGLMAVVTVQLTRAAIVDVPTLLLGVASGALLLLTGVSSTWLVLGGAVAGAVLRSVA